jgi:hypothetical protein
MKAILIFLILISSFTSFSQSDNVMSDYTLKLETLTITLDYKLTLSQIVHLTSTIIQILKNGIPPEINKYGKENGLWKTM